MVHLEMDYFSDQRNKNKKMNPIPRTHFCRDLRKYLREYTEFTGIQGLRYIGEKRSMFEKIFWIIIVLISLGGCIYMICEVVWKYQNSPVLVSFATKETPIHEIPFPSITICPESKSSAKKFDYGGVYVKYIDENDRTIPNETLRTFHYLSLLCDPDDEAFGNKTVDEDFFDVINSVKPHNEGLCFFMGKPKGKEQDKNRCDNILIPIITDEGICYSFNILGRDRIFKNNVLHYADFHLVKNDSRYFDGESGYVEDAGISVYPRRALMSGTVNSFTMVFFHDREDNDYTCAILQGYRVMLHNPNDIPLLSQHSLFVPLNKIVIAAVEPKLITTSTIIKKYNPEKRNCYLRDERALKFFKTYSQSNCMLECITNYTLEQCGCVSFYMPREKATPLCGTGMSACIKRAQDTLRIKELEDKIAGKFNEESAQCDCKPSCTHLTFDAEISQGDLMWQDYVNSRFKHYGLNLNTDEIHVSMLLVYLKSDHFITMERNELYGISDLISNFGGLLGLFTGFSLISLVEIIYFMSLRIYYNVKLYGSWSGTNG